MPILLDGVVVVNDFAIGGHEPCVGPADGPGGLRVRVVLEKVRCGKNPLILKKPQGGLSLDDCLEIPPLLCRLYRFLQACFNVRDDLSIAAR